jgi:hypothetical protein
MDQEANFDALVAEAQEQIDESIQRAGLLHDPYGWVFSAQSLILGVLPRFVKEITQARRPWAIDERKELVRQIVRTDIQQEVRILTAEGVRLSMIWMVAGGFALLGAGYLLGTWHSAAAVDAAVKVAEARIIRTQGKLAALGDTLDPKAAENWVTLMQNNGNPQFQIARCEKDSVQTARTMCWFRLWVESASAPATSNEPPQPEPPAQPTPSPGSHAAMPALATTPVLAKKAK